MRKVGMIAVLLPPSELLRGRRQDEDQIVSTNKEDEK